MNARPGGLLFVLAVAIAATPAPPMGIVAPLGSGATQGSALERGVEALRAGDLGAAVAALEQAAAMAPASVEPHFWLGVARLEAGEPAAAAEALRRAEELSSRFDRRIAYQLGVALMRNGELDAARSRFEAVVTADPSAALPRLNLGWVLIQQDQGLAALELFKAVMADDPGNALAYYYAGRVYDGNGRVDEAAAAYQAALQRSPDLLQALVALGRLEIARGELEAGRGVFERLRAQYPNVAEAPLRLGLIELREGNVESAIELLERALTLDPANQAARYNLGLAYGRAGRAAEARAVLDRFDGNRSAAAEVERAARRRQAESRAESLVRRAREEVAAKDWEAARMALVESLDLEPGNGEAGVLLATVQRERARAFLASGEAARAVEALEAAVGLQPGDAASWELLVEAYAAAGDDAGAERARRRLRALRGGQATAEVNEMPPGASLSCLDPGAGRMR